jgi:DNA-binding transcriptional ArsR family regulator
MRHGCFRKTHEQEKPLYTLGLGITINHMVKYQEQTLKATFAALADPSRRAMLARLATGDATVGELAKPLSMSLPAVTKHLNVLQKAGLITRHRDGRMRRCHLRGEQLAEALAWMEETRHFWNIQLDALAQHLEQSEDGGAKKTRGTHR